jgi:hypothetical protein
MPWSFFLGYIHLLNAEHTKHFSSLIEEQIRQMLELRRSAPSLIVGVNLGAS